MVTASDGFKSITRNSNIFKIITKNLKPEEDRREQEELEDYPAERAENPDPTDANDGSLWWSQRQRRPPARLTAYVQIIY